MGQVAAVLLAAGPVLGQEAQATAPVIEVSKPAATVGAGAAKAGGEAKPAVVTRESVITAAKIEFDNKEGVILFDENVFVDDAQFLMRSDRLLVFMESTNDVNQIMAIGHVNITNANRTASCNKAVYTKKDGKIVMTGDARLKQQGKQAGDVSGDRITIWVDDERMVVEPGTVTLPPGTFNKGGMQKLLP
jgi:lipopolysaccharide transport protein LptA